MGGESTTWPSARLSKRGGPVCWMYWEEKRWHDHGDCGVEDGQANNRKFLSRTLFCPAIYY